jgi:sugar lactone lactonase YvrE
VQLFPSDDQPRILFDRASHSQVQLHGPRGIALSGDGNVYVCDTNNHRVVHFRCA